MLSQVGDRREMAWVLRYGGHVWQTPWQTQELYRKVLAIFEESGDERGSFETVYRLGWVATQLGNYQEAEQLLQDSLTLAQKFARREIILDCLVELGHVHWAFGNYQKAEEFCRQSISISREIGYHSQIAYAQRYLARIALSLDDYQTAMKHLQDSLAIYEELGLRGLKAETFGEMSHVAVNERDFATAGQLAQDSLTLCQELEHRAGEIEPYTVLGEAALGLGDFQAAAQHFQRALQTAGDVCLPSYALHALVGLAKLLAAVDEKARAYDLTTFILHHPASWQWSKDSVAPLAAELEAVTAALKWGTEKNLEEVIEELSKVVV
jgi:tetratricopeptide (TPR) repeat protein